MAIIFGIIICLLALCLGLSKENGNEQIKKLVGEYCIDESKGGSWGWESIKVYESKDDIILEVVFRNDTDSNIKLGPWIAPATAILETSEDKYSISGYLDVVNCYSSKDFSMTFEGAKGKVKSLEFREITFLGSSGLPSGSGPYTVDFDK